MTDHSNNLSLHPFATFSVGDGESRIAMNSTIVRDRRGISRIEAGVVLAILGLLVTLVVPAIQRARESARQSQCRNTLKQLVLGLHIYHDAMRSFPYGCIGNSELPPEKRWSWYLCLGNYVGQYGTPMINYERPWDDPARRPLQLRTWRNGPFEEFEVPLIPYPVIKCPNGTRETYSDGQPLTDYVGAAGIAPDAEFLPLNSNRAGVWAYNECRSLLDMQDGTSSTVIAIESSSRNGCWIAGGSATVRDYSPDAAPIGPGRQFGGLHHRGSMAAFVDGSVSFLSDATSPDVLSALLTIAGSEPESDSVVRPR